MQPLSEAAPAIILQDATVLYQNTPLFEDLTVQFPAGNVTCLLGPSGIGKSSLLRLLAGLLKPKQAKITASDGKPLTGRIAYTAQQQCLLPWLSAIDNVSISLKLHPAKAKDNAYAVSLLHELGLGEEINLRPTALSGGMQQRVALARILFENKPVVLLDEPFSAVDAITRYQLQDLIAQHLKGRTVIFVTHDLIEALRLANHIYVMADKPVRIKNHFTLQSTTPRSLSDPDVQRLQGELWHCLVNAHA